MSVRGTPILRRAGAVLIAASKFYTSLDALFELQ
jgi:hypothetical protein